VESYNLVSFTTLCITDKSSVLHLLHLIDTSNGYAFTNTAKEFMERGQGAEEGSTDTAYSTSMFNLVHTEGVQPQGEYRIREKQPPQEGG